MNPLVGIVTRGRSADGRYSVDVSYVDAVRRSGGEPFFLPPGSLEPDKFLAMAKAVILIGGGDIDVAHFGGKDHPANSPPDRERDRTELQISRILAFGTTPTLAICRGMQVVNVALGGTLIEHIPDECGTTVSHRAEPPGPVSHEIAIEPGTTLGSALRVDRCSVPSHHHQAVRETASGLTVSARSSDGVIEGVEKPDHPWFIGVQWHPEKVAASDPVQQRLFDALIEAASR